MVPESGPDIPRAIVAAYSRVTCVAVILALKTICIEAFRMMYYATIILFLIM